MLRENGILFSVDEFVISTRLKRFTATAQEAPFSELEGRAPASLNLKFAKYQTRGELSRIYDGKNEARF